MENHSHNTTVQPRILLFDLGGVVFELGYEEAVRRFAELGLHEAANHLDASVQTGIFGQLERGEIDKNSFRQRLSEMVGREVSLAECTYAWLGYFRSLPSRNLKALRTLRAKGFRLCLLSNTNPFMLDFVRSSAFDGQGHSLDDYFDRLFVSCELKLMKPEPSIFKYIMEQEGASPQEILFLDDSSRNTSAAESLGIPTLLAEDAFSWVEALGERLGVRL